MSRWQLLLVLLTSSLVATAPSGVRGEKPLPRVPEGYTVELAAAAPLVEHPLMGSFDDKGRLYIAENAGLNLRADDLLAQLPNSIRRLEDTDGDGRFDKSTVFADKMSFPQGALWYRGALYVASPPSIWKLVDTDDDGVADERTELVNKFGFTGNAADIHGCFLGPDGRIYWCDGRHGHEIDDAEGNLVTQGKAARIFSCRPDGSDVQVLCGGGMDNPVEIDFLPEGEAVGTVNILLQPRGDALVHWIEGGVWPHQAAVITEFQRTGDLMPPIVDLGHVAVSGTTRVRSPHLASGKGHDFFITQFNTHRVIRSTLERNGGTFQSREEPFLESDNPDFHATDVLEDADGSLLVIDTGGWFRIGCPTSQIAKPDLLGAIYRVRRTGSSVDDPRGHKLRLEERRPVELVTLLDDPRPAVQERAIDLLSQKGGEALDALAAVLKDTGASDTARRNAIWSLTRMDQQRARRLIVPLLNDGSSESVKITAATALGASRDAFPTYELTQALAHGTPAVQRAAATTLGHILDAQRITGAPDNLRLMAVETLFDVLPQAESDRFLEHAFLYALIRIDDAKSVRPYLEHNSPYVRRGALIALDQMVHGDLARADVARLLEADDPALQRQALDVVGRRDGWVDVTVDLLQGWLESPGSPSERTASVRALLLAQSGDPAIQQFVGAALLRRDLPPEHLRLLLEVMTRATTRPAPAAWMPGLTAALASPDPVARLEAVRAVETLEIVDLDPQLKRLLESPEESDEIRVNALAALAPRLTSVESPLFSWLMERLTPDAAPLERLAVARALADAPLSDVQLVELSGRFAPAGPLALPVLLRAYARSREAQVGKALVAGLQAPGVALALAPEELATLVNQFPPDVAKQAEGLLASLGVDLAEQQARLEALAPLATGGDTHAGRQVFRGKKAACAGCHTVGGVGGNVGPDLTTIGASRSARDLIEAILYPSASFARDFRSYVVVTGEGKVHTGVIGHETADAVYLRGADLKEVRVPRDQIEELRESNTSIMPKSLDTTLSPDELRDLLAYLQSLKKR